MATAPQLNDGRRALDLCAASLARVETSISNDDLLTETATPVRRDLNGVAVQIKRVAGAGFGPSEGQLPGAAVTTLNGQGRREADVAFPLSDLPFTP